MAEAENFSLEPTGDQGLSRSEREELSSHRLMDLLLTKVQKIATTIGAIVSLLVAFGLFGFYKYYESLISASADKETKQISERISEAVSKRVEAELAKVDQRLVAIGGVIEDAKKKVERAELETDIRLKGTVGRVQDIGQLLVDDVEKRRRETISELTRESQRFDEARKEAEKRSEEVLARIRAELASLERLTTVVRAPLREKIATLRALPLEKSAHDADVQRHIGILVLKEIEDAELVKREALEREASLALAELFAKESLREEYFAEVRFRIVRAAGELGLVDLVSQRASDPKSWERSNLILLLGALGDPKAIPALVRVVKNKSESFDFRGLAIRSLAAIGRRPEGVAFDEVFLFLRAGMHSLGAPFPEDREIEALRPRTRRDPFSIPRIPEELSRLSVDSVSSTATDKNERGSLRKVALRALRRLGGRDVIAVMKQVLFEEWKDYGDDAIDVLSGIRGELSVATLQEFVLLGKAERPLRLKCISALAEMVNPLAVTALRDIAERDPDEEVRASARKAANTLADKLK